jgi:hypothetical protein
VSTALHLGWLEQAQGLAREALALFWDMGPAISWRYNRSLGGMPTFVALFIENLAQAEKSGDQPTITLALIAVAAQIWGLGQLEKAVRLYAAAVSAAFLTHFLPPDRTDFDHIRTGTLLQLDEVTFKQAWAEGSAMTLAQAVAYARQAMP